MSKTLDTWSGKKQFRYEFNRCTLDVCIHCGGNFSRSYGIDGSSLRAALAKFSGKVVPIGTHRTAPPANSFGEWFRIHHRSGGIMSYLGPLLIEEGYAKRDVLPDHIAIL